MSFPPFRSIRGAFCLALVLLLAALIAHEARRTPTARSFPDTHAYFATASAELGSQEFLAGSRAPFVPLIYKIARKNPAAIDAIQWIIFAVSWVYLGVALALQQRTAITGIAALALVLGFSLSSDVVLWNDALLSESICISAMALSSGAWLLYLQKPTYLRAIAALIASAMLCFSRDTSAYVVLCIGVLLITVSAWGVKKGGNTFSRSGSLLGISMLVLFSASVVSHTMGDRFEYPFYNVVGRRILTREDHRSFFADRGMPLNDAVLSRKGKWARSDSRFFLKDPDLQDFREWRISHGRKTYIALLASHPVYTIGEPLRDLPRLIHEHHLAYAHEDFEMTSIGRLGALWNSAVPPSARLFGGLALVLSAALLGLRTESTAWLVSAGLFGFGFVHLVAAWHGDALEVPRHTLIAVIQIRIAVIISACMLLDEAFAGPEDSEPEKANGLLSPAS